MNYLKNEFQQISIFLLPVRLFIGLAWMRAGLEKLSDPQWYSGDTITLFFQEQIQNGDAVFPFYQSLVLSVFEPNAGILAGIILFAEFYVGVAILLGCFTNLALVGGIFMNLNFLLAGSANPSIFYIVIQAFLLFMGSGTVLSIDSFISQKLNLPFIVAQKESPNPFISMHHSVLAILAGIMFAMGLWSTIYVQDLTLSRPDDPALSVILLCVMAGTLFSILAIRAWSTLNEGSDQSEYMPLESVPTMHRQPEGLTWHSVPTIPQISVNNYATLLVPHNIAGTAINKPATLATKKTAMAARATKVSKTTQSSIDHKARTVLETSNEVSTLLTPYILLEKISTRVDNHAG